MRFVFSYIFIFFAFNHSYSCDCESRKSVNDEIKASDIVMTGYPISHDIFTADSAGNIKQKRYTFIIEKVYKGIKTADTIQILTGLGGGDCGYNFEKRMVYVVYGNYYPEYTGGKAMLYTNICTRTQLKNAAEISQIESAINPGIAHPVKNQSDSSKIDTMFLSCSWKHYTISMYQCKKSGHIKTFKDVRFDTFFYDFSGYKKPVTQGTPFKIWIKYKKPSWLISRWQLIDVIYEEKKQFAILRRHAKNKQAFIGIWLDKVNPPYKCIVYSRLRWYSLKRRWHFN